MTNEQRPAAADLRSIIARIDAGEVSRELDGEIFRAVHPDRDWYDFDGIWYSRDPEDGAAFDIPPSYLTSLDAAMALVPPDHDWSLHVDNGAAVAGCAPADPDGCSWSDCHAPTPAAALTSAALKARINDDQ
jgi:hypothetical protein